MSGSDTSPNADMTIARTRTRFDVEQLRDFLHGGHDGWLLHNSLVKVLSEDLAFDKSERSFMSRSERYKRTLKMMKRVLELKEQHGWTPDQYALAEHLLDEPLPFALHSLAFAGIVMSQGSPLLVNTYGELIANRGILGCYLQTELGHGSNVAGLETTATYIPESQEFEIHSPTLTSTKWWIGALSKTATHGVVQARLILPGRKDMGPHLFFVQLRSLENHKVLPNITIGDIGPKAMGGYNSVDNGYARFNHLRIPKAYMLSRFAQVTDMGEYVRPPHAKMSYGGMLILRSRIVAGHGWIIAKAITIAIRYATVRRQGNKDQGGLERQVITYPTVYYRLLPILARAYVFVLLGRNLTKMFTALAARIDAGDTSPLAEMHVISSGLKSMTTAVAIQDVETARRALGGHGFSEFAGLGRIYADNVPSTTYEGDNFVLDQQVARGAVKAYQIFASREIDASAGLPPSAFYLRLLSSPTAPKIPMSKGIDWHNIEFLIILLELRAALTMRQHTANLGDLDASAEQRAARAVMDAFVARQIPILMTNAQSQLGQPETAVFRDLLTLYLLTVLETSLVDLLSLNILSIDPTEDATLQLRKAVRDLCLKLLPQSIGLTDSFGFTDWELDSSLGRYDGRVYESLWERAQLEPLNRTEVPDGYKEYLRPLLERGQRSSHQAKL